jgi:hypothetical protein
MSYDEFVNKVNEIANKANINTKCKNKGEFYVAYAGDVTISAKSSSDNLTVCWGEYSDMAPGMYAGKHKAQIKVGG